MPSSESADRKIIGMPLYSQAEVLALLNEQGSECIIAWTRKCKNDLQKYTLDSEDVLELVKLCFQGGRFLSSEWCRQSPDGCWAACDAYIVCIKQWIPSAHKDMNVEYYVKFAISKTGKVLLLVSCHLCEN